MLRFSLSHRAAVLAAGACMAAGLSTALFAPVAGAATTTIPAGAVALQPPAIPDVAPLPGPMARQAQPSPTMGILNVVPDQGVVGTPMTISGSGLPAGTALQLTWSTANVTWVLSPQAGTVNYMGRSETKFAVVLDRVKTDAKGAFKVALRPPRTGVGSMTSMPWPTTRRSLTVGSSRSAR